MITLKFWSTLLQLLSFSTSTRPSPPVFLQEREAKEAQAGDVLNVESEAALREEKVGRMGISKTMQKKVPDNVG